MSIGREDYQDRRDARVERYEERAARAQAESDAASKAAVEAVKPGLRTTLSVWLTGVCTAAAAVSMLYDLFKKDET